MSYSQALVESAVSSGLYRSFYAIAKDRGKSTSYINNLKTGDMRCTPYMSAFLAEKQGIDPLLGIALVQLEKAKDKKEKEYWKSLILRLRKEEDFRLVSST